MTYLRELHHFLEISVTRTSDGLFLSERQYAMDLLQRAGMAECHSTATPVDTQAKLSATDGAPMASSRCASSCMTRVSLIWRCSSVSSGM